METIVNINQLIERIEQGESFKYLYFWGHTPKARDQADKSCLSQWYPADFSVDGISYKTAEHYMMAEKARLFDSDDICSKILAVDHPAEAKKLGRKIQNFDESTWNEKRFDIVVNGNIAKFSQNPELQRFLLGTGNRVLVEASPQDKIWGIGLDQSDKRASDPKRWLGKNLLGFALMKAREILQA